MKRTILITALLWIGLSNISAQEIGLRFGNFLENNVAIDGVFNLEKGRIHADFTFGDGVGIDALYDLIVNPLDGANHIYYYFGVGGTAFFGDSFKMGVAAEAGLEYRFSNIPLVLGIDYRPYFVIVDTTEFNWDGFGFNARYVFKK